MNNDNNLNNNEIPTMGGFDNDSNLGNSFPNNNMPNNNFNNPPFPDQPVQVDPSINSNPMGINNPQPTAFDSENNFNNPPFPDQPIQVDPNMNSNPMGINNPQPTAFDNGNNFNNMNASNSMNSMNQMPNYNQPMNQMPTNEYQAPNKNNKGNKGLVIVLIIVAIIAIASIVVAVIAVNKNKTETDYETPPATTVNNQPSDTPTTTTTTTSTETIDFGGYTFKKKAGYVYTNKSSSLVIQSTTSAFVVYIYPGTLDNIINNSTALESEYTKRGYTYANKKIQEYNGKKVLSYEVSYNGQNAIYFFENTTDNASVIEVAALNRTNTYSYSLITEFQTLISDITKSGTASYAKQGDELQIPTIDEKLFEQK